MFDVKVGDKLVCKKNSPFGAWTQFGEEIVVTSVEKLRNGTTRFKYKRTGINADGCNWSANTAYDWFEHFVIDLENK